MKNENYLCIGGQKIAIPKEKLEDIRAALDKRPVCSLEKKKKGETIAHIGEFDFLVLERSGDTVSMVLKGLYAKGVQFGKNNDFRGSNVQKICREFADKLADIVGADNIVEHTVDLTSDDGLKDYGAVKEKVSLLTTNLYRRYVNVLDIDRLKENYWLVTPYSTPKHEDAEWIKCVSPLGNVITGSYNRDYIGVRPFCIFSSSIFDSCEE